MGKRIPFKNNTTEKDKIRGTLVRLASGFFFGTVSVLIPIRQPKSIAGVSFDSARRFRATLLLRTTCMRLCCNGVASCACVLLCFIKPILGNRYVLSRGFIVSESRETHPRSECVCVALFYYTDIGESCHSLNQGTWGGRPHPTLAP